MSEDRKGCSQCEEVDVLLRAEIERGKLTRRKADITLQMLHAEHGLFNTAVCSQGILIQECLPLL